VLEKPTLPAELQGIYKQLLAGVHQSESNQVLKKNALATLRPLRILVAEDNKVNQTVIRGILKRFNQQPDIVDDGEEAVAYITRQEKCYDLVIMDCEMANVDGVDATRQIRQWELANNRTRVPIVALTAHVLPEQMQSCYDAGMDAYLTKPIDVDEIQKLLSTHAARDAADLSSDSARVVKSG